MDFGHKSGDESGNGGSRDVADRPIPEAVKAERETLPKPMPPCVAPRGHPHAISTLGKKAISETVEFTSERILEPLTVAFRQRAAVQPANIIEAWSQMPTLPSRTSARMAIKAKGRILFIDAADVIAVEAKGNYVLLLHTSGSHMLRESISAMEEKLNFHGFVRIHRSVLVNAALVEEIQPWCTGEYVLRVRGGREYTVTRTYKRNLQLLAQSWIGTEGFDTE